MAIHATNIKSIPSAGICGSQSDFVLYDGTRLKCNLPISHGGEHSWQKYRILFLNNVCSVMEKKLHG